MTKDKQDPPAPARSFNALGGKTVRLSELQGHMKQAIENHPALQSLGPEEHLNLCAAFSNQGFVTGLLDYTASPETDTMRAHALISPSERDIYVDRAFYDALKNHDIRTSRDPVRSNRLWQAVDDAKVFDACRDGAEGLKDSKLVLGFRDPRLRVTRKP